MTAVLALVRRAADAPRLAAAADTYARGFGGHVTVLVPPRFAAAALAALPERGRLRVVDDAGLAAAVRAEAGTARGAVLVAAGPVAEEDCDLETLMRGQRMPALVVPPRATVPPHRAVSRILVPLDGTEGASAAAERGLGRLSGSGVELVVVHVFGADTVPAFWDQAVHAQRGWGEEFLARNLTQGHRRLELRTGDPVGQIVDASESNDVDLVALGWSGSLARGRAVVVRGMTSVSRVPVLLLPMEGGRDGV